MIPIKIFAKKKDSGGSGSGSSTTVINQYINQGNDWFEWDPDNNAVKCRYNLYSVGSVSALGMGEGAGGIGVSVVDNLTSTDSQAALSANQGRVLKQMIDDIQTQGGGQVLNTVDWSNVQNKPSTFTPSAHVHSQGEVTGLGAALSNLQSSIGSVQQQVTTHSNNSSVHLSASDRQKLDLLTEAQIRFLISLMNVIEINGTNIKFNGNVLSSNDVTAQVR